MAGTGLVHRLRQRHSVSKHAATSTVEAISHPSSELGEQAPSSILNTPVLTERRISVRPRSVALYADKAIAQLKLGSKSVVSSAVTVRPQQTLGDLFVALPQELRIQILVQVPLNDLLSLRRSSVEFHNLVKSCESPIVRHHVRHVLTDLELKLYPPPSPWEADLTYLIKLRHREVVVRKLAKQLCDFVAVDVLKRNNQRKRREFEPRYQHMYSRMLPLLLIIGHFFERFRTSVLDRCFANTRNPGRPFRLVPGTTVWDEQFAILDQYQKQQLLDCYHMYGFILQVFERKLRPSRLTRLLGLVVPGLRRKPATTQEIQTTLVLGGVDLVQRILAGPTYAERRRALSSFLAGLDPGANRGWTTHWRGLLGPDADRTPLHLLPRAALAVPPLHVIWVPCALEVLLRARAIEDVDFRGGAAQRSAREFVRDLLGYDLFRADLLHATNGAEEDVGDEDEEGGDDGMVDADDFAESSDEDDAEDTDDESVEGEEGGVDTV